MTRQTRSQVIEPQTWGPSFDSGPRTGGRSRLIWAFLGTSSGGLSITPLVAPFGFPGWATRRVMYRRRQWSSRP
jgi:hypothetical protein